MDWLDFALLRSHSVYYWILIVLLLLGVMAGLGTASLLWLRGVGRLQARSALAGFLSALGFTLLFHTLVFTGFFQTHPRWLFLPVYATLWIPVLLFYYVKLTLYPRYNMRLTDVKHFILPLGQFLFFLVVFFAPVSYKEKLDRAFWNPFYGALEQILYLLGFYLYSYFAYRYMRRKERNAHTKREHWQIVYLKQLLKGLLILFSVHAVFVVSDAAMYRLMGINMRSEPLYIALGMLSFAGLAWWTGIYGVQASVWGRQLFTKKR